MKYEGVNKLIIKTKSGHEILVDDEDWEKVRGYGWNISQNYRCKYAQAYVHGKGNVLMHRIIMENPDLHVDHIDGNGLNNQKDNLRLCTRKQNSANSRKIEGTSSKYKGVSWFKHLSKWESYIWTGEKRASLGYFNVETEAAIAYNKAALELHGEFARLNVI